MKRRTPETKIARIFTDTDGYYWCDNTGPLDKSGQVHTTKAAAMEAACRDGYRYATGSGTYWGNAIRAIPEFIRARARH